MARNTKNQTWPKRILIYTDGASRGNPGPSAIGIHVTDESHNTIYQEGECLPKHSTNNYAEYTAVIEALKIALKRGASSLLVHSDSELLVRQVTGEYKVKSKIIKPLFAKCLSLIEKFQSCDFKHISRSKNTIADGLANKALNLNKRIF